MNRGPSPNPALPFLITGLLTLGGLQDSAAQAWVNLPGHGSLTTSYTYFRGGDHLYSRNIDGAYSRGYTAKGNRWFLGRTTTHTATIRVDYGLVRRAGVSADLSHVTGLYEGRAPINVAIDDGDYHGSLQDARIQFRYLLFSHPVVITPFIAYSIPTTEYPDHGHAALGLGFNEWQFGVFAGRSLAPFVSRSYVHLGVLQSMGEALNGHHLARTSIDTEVGHSVGKSLTLRASASFLDSSGGEDWLDPAGSIHDPGPYRLGTAFSDSRYLRFGLGTSMSSIGGIEISVDYVTTLSGQNIEDGDFLTLTTSWAFSTPFADPRTR